LVLKENVLKDRVAHGLQFDQQPLDGATEIMKDREINFCD